MNRKYPVFLLAAVVALAALPAAAKEKQVDALKETIDQIKSAVGKGDVAAAHAAFARAVSIRGSYEPKKLAPLAAAIGKGVGHKSQEIALAAVETLGQLKLEGTSKQLGKLLAPPAKVSEDKVGIHVAAIKAAGEIHDGQSLKALEKLLEHPHGAVAAAGAEAFAGYRNMEEKPRLSLVKKLVGSLDKLDKRIEKEKDETKRGDVEKVRDALNTALAALSRNETAKTVDEWEAWLKEQKK